MREGLSLDVVSGGELYTAIQAGFPAEQSNSMATINLLMNWH